MKTYTQLQQEFGATAPAILTGYLEGLDEIKEQPLDTGGLDDYISGPEYQRLEYEQKMSKAVKAWEATRESYTAALQDHHEAVRSFKAKAEPELFHVESADAGSRAALATDAQLSQLMDYAAKTGNADLAKACSDP
jgi:hypothetical protein